MKNEVSNEQYEEANENSDNSNIIRSVTNKFSSLLDIDERRECGLEGLWRALQNHDYTKKQKFTTSLYKFVRWMCLRKVTKKHRDKIKAEKIGVSTSQEFYYDSNLENNVVLSDLMSQLNDEDRVYIEQKHLQGHTLEEIGVLHGFTRQAASLKVKDAMSRLRTLAYNSVE
jgi:RNA polymerase sigma factor (sigma-70 family)